MSIAVGKADYSGSGGGGGENMGPRRPRVYKLGTGKKDPGERTMLLRIAPPVGDCAEKGTWATFIKQHYGYTLPYSKKDGSQGQFPVTFICVERRDREGNIVQHCTECDEIKSHREKIKNKEAVLKDQGKSEDEIEAALGFLKAWTRQHNLDKKWYFVAKNINNEWSFGAVSHTCFQLLKGKAGSPGLIETLVARNKDPLGVENGVWFRFSRNGSNFNDITDIPSVEQVEIEPEVFKTKTDSLTENDFVQIEKLPSLMVLPGSLSQHITPEQVDMLVASGNDEKVVRSVFNMPERAKKGAASTPALQTQTAPKPAPADDEPGVDEVEASTPATTKTASTEAPTASSAPAEDDEEAAALKALEAARARKKAAAAATTAPAPAKTEAKTTTAKLPPALQAKMDMPMEDFLAQYEK